ncbi:MAG TPA: RNA-binding protein [Candidatus Binatia bacterium]|nr:RNA-binding protein [Candidatus Binatia bacterium]
MRIYIGGLPFAVTDKRLEEIFAAHGAVASAQVITDKFTGRSKGFGFVEMSSDSEAKSAIEALNGTELDGRTITVNEARPRENRPRFEDEGRGGRGEQRRGGGSGKGRW